MWRQVRSRWRKRSRELCERISNHFKAAQRLQAIVCVATARLCRVRRGPVSLCSQVCGAVVLAHIAILSKCPRVVRSPDYSRARAGLRQAHLISCAAIECAAIDFARALAAVVPGSPGSTLQSAKIWAGPLASVAHQHSSCRTQLCVRSQLLGSRGSLAAAQLMRRAQHKCGDRRTQAVSCQSDGHRGSAMPYASESAQARHWSGVAAAHAPRQFCKL